MLRPEAKRNIEIAEEVINAADEDDVPVPHAEGSCPQSSLEGESASTMDCSVAATVPQSKIAEGQKVLLPQAASLLQSCWGAFAQQNRLNEEESRDIFVKTQQQLEKRGFASVQDFGTAPDHRWPARMPPRLVEMIRQLAQEVLATPSSTVTPNYIATGSVEEKRQRTGNEEMHVDSSFDDNAERLGNGRGGSSTDKPVVDVDMSASDDTTTHISLSELELMEIHLVDAIVKNGFIAERRQKYMDKWRSTFVGTFCIHPPKVTAQTRNAEKLNKINKFEFFMWSNVRSQPKIDYIKRRIAEATQTRTSDFKLETMWGEQLPYNAVAKDEFEKIVASERFRPTLERASLLENKPLVDLRIVAK